MLRRTLRIGVVAVMITLVACTTHPVGRRPSPTASSSLFDGTVSGWRIAPQAVIDREGLGRHLDLTCTPREVHAETKTSFDLSLGYVPPGVRDGSHGTIKWICDTMALSVDETFSASSSAILDVERALWGPYRAVPYDVPSDRVEPCIIAGHPAACIHPDDDVTGRGDAYVLVIENDDLAPYATILRIHASDIPFSDVLRTANQAH